MFLNVLKMYRSAQNNLSPSCNITLAAARESCREFWLSLLVGSAGICPWCTPGWLVHALQQHTTCWSHPGQSKENSTDGLRLQTLPTVISDRVAEFLQSVGPSQGITGMWKWIHCGKSESQAQFGLVVGVSDNSPSEENSNLESFWGLGQEEPKVWSCYHFSIFVVVLKPACVQVRVCVIPPGDFPQEPGGQKLIFGWWAISSRQLPLFSRGFLFHFFFITNLVL